MEAVRRAIEQYATEVVRLTSSATTTESSYYPSIRSLLVTVLKHLGLPADVRTTTSERRPQGGTDVPDLAVYDGEGDFVIVCGEVKLPGTSLSDVSVSTDRNDQIGRYLAQTGVVLVSNVHAFGLLTADASADRTSPVPPEQRRLEQIAELWPSRDAMAQGNSVALSAADALVELLEAAVTRYAPIAEPETLARVLALQARRAKAGLPPEFTDAVSSLAEDFGTALGIAFEGDEGEEFFRSSLIQTVYYGIFAGWILWAQEDSGEPFDWRNLPQYLRIPFLGDLFHEIQHPRRIAELGLAPRLDVAVETLSRVDQAHFFDRLTLPSLGMGLGQSVSTAIVYFYEPFLQAFDPELRKELGVWYTPPEIVRYQVRKVDALLRSELGCARGFADERVVVLDPACGTAAYLIEVLDCVAETLRREGVVAELGETLLQAVRERVFGFEILTAPFVVSHLQLHLILASLGAEPTSDERPGVFLTNSLTGWEEEPQIRLHFPELQEEHDAAHRVKAEARIIVILGNPPYNRFIGAPIEEEQELADSYKGIRRDAKGRQIDATELYRRWGIRKHLLDDLYVRFFRLAEIRIGEVAAYGIVSLITNSSFLTGRSHPLMREHLVTSFQEIWIDNLNGDKYKTGKIIPDHAPGAGSADQSIFSTPQNPGGIQIGTAVTTLLKLLGEAGEVATVHYRDLWGRADDKRDALVRSLEMTQWSSEELDSAAESPHGPRRYQAFTPEERRRWKLVPYESIGGYDDWYSFDELFPVSYQGVNPNRGLQGSVIDHDRASLEERMRDYYSDQSFDWLAEQYPGLCRDRARYNARETREALIRTSAYSSERVVPYALFPLDGRYIYYETEEKLLNECRRKLWTNLEGNEFLVAVPEPRLASESLPLFATTAFDLHLHDRGSVGFPAQYWPPVGDEGLFTEAEPRDPVPRANISDAVWATVHEEWGISGDLDSVEARTFARQLFRVCLALSHSPQYQLDHRESLAQDWARVPIPRDRGVLQQLVEIGDLIATLLEPFTNPRSVIEQILGSDATRLAVLGREGGGSVRSADLVVDISYYGSARGRWRERPVGAGESTHSAWGESTGDLFINGEIFFHHVPLNVWSYELGGYPVLKKWLGYRHARYRNGEPLTLEEKDTFRQMVQRIAALLALHPRLNRLYEQAAAEAWVVDES